MVRPEPASVDAGPGTGRGTGHGAVHDAGLALGPRRWVVATCAVLLGGALAVVSLFVGSGDISTAEAWRALVGDGTSSTDLVVRDFRVPRTLLAVAVGAALGASGALIQGVTRNPLADPGLLGVNAGAFLLVVVAVAFLDVTSTTGQVWFALVGALATSGTVYLIGMAGRQGGNPVQLVLAGVAIGAVFSGVSYGITLTDPEAFDRLRFWQAGSLQGRQMEVVTGVLPFVLGGLLLALALPRSLNALALGDELARGLGTRIVAIRVLALLAITLLCGAATAAVGPVSFLGLMVPHAVRLVVGADQRWVVPLSMLVAPILFLGSDIVGRVVISQELPVGIVTALLGAPVLVWLVRRREAAAL